MKKSNSLHKNSEIKITCVTNGYVVEMPVVESTLSEKIIDKVMGQFSHLKNVLEERDETLQKILNEAENKNEDESKKIISAAHIHVFTKWSEVLAFLRTQMH